MVSNSTHTIFCQGPLPIKAEINEFILLISSIYINYTLCRALLLYALLHHCCRQIPDCEYKCNSDFSVIHICDFQPIDVALPCFAVNKSFQIDKSKTVCILWLWVSPSQFETHSQAGTTWLFSTTRMLFCNFIRVV